MDNSQLISACKKHDRNAQRELYERFAPIMKVVCLRYCGDIETAHDLLHDGFIRVFTQIGSFTGKGSFEGWLRRIFVNLALESFRKEKQKNRFLEEYSYLLATETENSGDNDDMLDIENIPRDEVMEMIRDLPPGYRMVFNLFIFEELSHREIAQMLGIKEAASRSQFFRAKKMLKNKISTILQHHKQVQ